MFTLRFVTEATDGGKLALILYIFYNLVSIILNSILLYRLDKRLSYYILLKALLIFLMGEFIIYDLLIGILFFNAKVYVNYGLGGGLFRLMLSHIVAVVLMFICIGKLVLKFENKPVLKSSVIFILIQPLLVFLLTIILNIYNV